MSSVMASVAATVHPHEIEIQDFDVYDLIIDARPAREYAQDRLPHAVSLPVAPLRPHHRDSHQGDLQSRTDAPLDTPPEALSVALPMSVRSIRSVGLGQQLRLRKLVCHLQPGALVLVYCSNAGRDSEVWAHCLEEMGFAVDVLGGGWPAYRRWVERGLTQLPRYLALQGFTAPPMGGLEAVARELVAAGEQVLLLDWVGADGGVPGFAWPALRRARQHRFETLLLDAMRRLDASRTAWVGWCWAPQQGIQLPTALMAALGQRPAMAISSPLSVREQGWRRVLESVHAEASTDLRLNVSTQLWLGMEQAGELLGLERGAIVPLRDLISGLPREAARRLAEVFGMPCVAPIEGVATLQVDLPTLESEAVSRALDQFKSLRDRRQVGLA